MRIGNVTHLPGTRLDLLDSLPKHAVCAELGVFAGDYSSQILKRCQPKHLYLVDLFRGQITSGDENGENMRTEDMEEMRWKLETKFGANPVSVVVADSIGWLLDQERGSLGWAYVDTSHDYQQTAGELIAARDAVENGGWICGHDFHREKFPGVVQSVMHFAMMHNLPLEIWEGDRLPSFKIKNVKRGDFHANALEQPLGSSRLP